MSRPNWNGERFIHHVSDDNLTRLFQQLIAIPQLTPAQSALADTVLQESSIKENKDARS